MKIVTWNIGEDERYTDGKLTIDSYDYIIDTILKNDIDIICLQEAIVKSEYIETIANYIKENTELKYSVEYDLSDSHINIGCRMGVVVCSKYELNCKEKFLFDNPKLVYKINENTTFYSHDKGFLFLEVEGIKLFVGHCLPFHLFKQDSKDFKEMFSRADDKFIENYNKEDKMIICGDFNYQDIQILFPKIMNLCKDVVKETTKKNRISDHFIVNDVVNVKSVQVEENIFDHKFVLVEI